MTDYVPPTISHAEARRAAEEMLTYVRPARQPRTPALALFAKTGAIRSSALLAELAELPPYNSTRRAREAFADYVTYHGNRPAVPGWAAISADYLTDNEGTTT